MDSLTELSQLLPKAAPAFKINKSIPLKIISITNV